MKTYIAAIIPVCLSLSVFFSYNKLVNNIFIHSFSAKRTIVCVLSESALGWRRASGLPSLYIADKPNQVFYF